jgi:hypothetical protein
MNAAQIGETRHTNVDLRGGRKLQRAGKRGAQTPTGKI